MPTEITAHVGAPSPIPPSDDLRDREGEEAVAVIARLMRRVRSLESKMACVAEAIRSIPGDAEAKGQPAPAPSAGLREEAEKFTDEAMQLWEKEPDDVSLAPFIADALLAFAAAHPPVVRVPRCESPPSSPRGTELIVDGWNYCLADIKALNPHVSFEEAKS